MVVLHLSFHSYLHSQSLRLCMLLLGNWRQNISHPKAEFVTLNFSGPLIIFHNITYPIIKLLNGSARGLTGLFGLK